jgi:hypothetical protein
MDFDARGESAETTGAALVVVGRDEVLGSEKMPIATGRGETALRGR